MKLLSFLVYLYCYVFLYVQLLNYQTFYHLCNYTIEIDIRKTKDDILVVFHDKTLKRLTGLSTSIENLKFNEIKKLKLLGTKEHIPTLKEVLKLVNGKVLIDIEIKNCQSWKKVCKILINDLSKYKYPYIIKSFNPKIIKYIKKLNENITVWMTWKKVDTNLRKVE